MAPEGCPEHWRFLLWGSEGSVGLDTQGQLFWNRAHEGPQEAPSYPPPCPDPFEDFMAHLQHGTPRWLTTEECFRSQMAALAAQLAADTGQRDLPVPGI
jgi:hypothetical protein